MRNAQSFILSVLAPLAFSGLIVWLGAIAVHIITFEAGHFHVLPCIMLTVSLPFACLCFPMFMRIVTMLNPGQQSQARGITHAQITNATRTVQWQPGMFGGGNDDNMCTITMEPYKAGDEVCVLPCEHHFSQSAINTWLRQHNTCPLCRQPIVAVGEDASARRAQGGDAGNTVAEADPQAGLHNVTTVQVAEAATR